MGSIHAGRFEDVISWNMKSYVNIMMFRHLFSKYRLRLTEHYYTVSAQIVLASVPKHNWWITGSSWYEQCDTSCIIGIIGIMYSFLLPSGS